MANDIDLSPLIAHSETSNKETLSQAQHWAVSKAMFIISILTTAKMNSDRFPLKDNEIIYDDFFKSKALSKDEIIRWQHVNNGGVEDFNITSEEFDALIKLCVNIGKINQKEPVLQTYYCLSI